MFSDLPAYFITVRCPLEVLEQSEKERKSCTWGQAKAQFDIEHAHGIYDLEVDTYIYSSAECALQINSLLESGSPTSTFKRLIRMGPG